MIPRERSGEFSREFTMLKCSVGSWIFKSVAGLAVAAVCAVGLPGSEADAIKGSHVSKPRVVESLECHRIGSKAKSSADRPQIVVSVPSTVFLRVDSDGRVIAAGTNTGCLPRDTDEVYVFRPDGTIEPTLDIDVRDCDWTGDFTVAGRYQPQSCRADGG
jgi:hypothetical protein